MKGLIPRLTYANVVSTLALFLVLAGGAAYATTQLAKNSVGTKQIKNGAVSGAKIKAGAVTGSKVAAGSLTGADIQSSSLGTVPSAQNADRLAGSPATSFRDACPSGTTAAAAALCLTPSNVGASSGSDTLPGAIADCAALGLRLPSPAEAMLLVAKTPAGSYWTDDFWTDSTAAEGPSFALSFKHDPEFPAGGLFAKPSHTELLVRCVTAPSQP